MTSSAEVPEVVVGPRRPSPTDDSSARLAWTLDELIRVPGTNIRFGLDSIIGFVPGIGDGAGFIFSAWIVLRGVLAGASPWTTARMVGNIVIDFVIGSIPLVGPVIDAFWKANTRNLELARRSASEVAGLDRESRLRVVASMSVAIGLLGLFAGLVIWLAMKVFS